LEKLLALLKLKTEYETKFPKMKEENIIGTLMFIYGIDETYEVISKAEGREINLSFGKGLNEIKYSYSNFEEEKITCC